MSVGANDAPRRWLRTTSRTFIHCLLGSDPVRRVHKYVHVALQSLAGVFILLGMVYVGKYKKASKEVFFYSLHSWTGIIAIAMYFLQYAAGDVCPPPAALLSVVCNLS